MKKLGRSIISLVIAFAVTWPTQTFGQVAARSKSSAGLNPLRISSEAMESLVSQVMPSVVQVVVTGFRRQESMNQSRTDVAVRRSRTVGSGVIVDGAGYVLTNAHVVDGAEHIRVFFADAVTTEAAPVTGQESRGFDARVIGKSDELDLALLAVTVKGLPALPLADYDSVRQGELVFAFGSPNELRNSVTMGVVSAVAQQVDPWSPNVWIQTDAAINPGNSGGPLVNADGELIGLNTFIRSMSGGTEGLGFAVPSAVIRLAYSQLRDYGHLHRALLGIAAQPITPQLMRGLGLPSDDGVIVADVTPGGPAAEAAIRVGDVITSIGGRSLGTTSMGRFHLFLLKLSDGERVSIDVLRSAKPLTMTATARVPTHQCERLEAVDVRANVVERLGFIGAAVDASTSETLPQLRAPSGVMVVVRLDTSRASELALTSGDVVHAVNGAWVTTPAELREALARFETGDAVVLQVERNGELTYLAFDME